MSALEIIGLRKEFRSGWRGRNMLTAVDNLDLSVAPGEIYGFLGPNGAGKSTTLKITMGFLTPTSGSVRLFGEDCGRWQVRENVGFLPENPVIYPYLTGYNALYFIGRMFSMTHSEIVKRIGRLADELGMERELKTQVRKHSKGMLQRVGLAQALINDPELLILDEPMSGLDPIGRKMLRGVILKRKEAGKTVFFSSHILADIEMICDRIGILHRGRTVFESSMDDVRKQADGRRLEDIFMEKVGAK